MARADSHPAVDLGAMTDDELSARFRDKSLSHRERVDAQSEFLRRPDRPVRTVRLSGADVHRVMLSHFGAQFVPDGPGRAA